MTERLRDGTASVLAPVFIRTCAGITAGTGMIFRTQTTCQPAAGNSKFTFHDM